MNGRSNIILQETCSVMIILELSLASQINFFAISMHSWYIYIAFSVDLVLLVIKIF